MDLQNLWSSLLLLHLNTTISAGNKLPIQVDNQWEEIRLKLSRDMQAAGSSHILDEEPGLSLLIQESRCKLHHITPPACTHMTMCGFKLWVDLSFSHQHLHFSRQQVHITDIEFLLLSFGGSSLWTGLTSYQSIHELTWLEKLKCFFAALVSSEL